MNRSESIVAVDEIRDYCRINGEVARLLDAGATFVRLVGVGRQRRLLSDLAGPWTATVAIEGDPGPESAARLDAPGLTVTIAGSPDDGLAAGMRSGTVLARGDADDAAGYELRGGRLVIGGSAGHRLGLAMSGGLIAVGGPAGRLVGEFQSGGTLVAPSFGPGLGRGAVGGLRGNEATDEVLRAWIDFRAAFGLTAAGAGP